MHLNGGSLSALNHQETFVLNALTVDVEDYFMVSAFSDVVRYDDWQNYESRIEKNTSKVLDVFDEHGVKATFFILGWVAKRHPGLVYEIKKRGHELACHSYSHRLAYDLKPDEFREDTRVSKRIIEDASGERIFGYRAPSYSITKDSLWTLDILTEEGFGYDSSIFPIHHDRYGIPEFGRFSTEIETKGAGRILEIPLSTVRLFGRNIPIAGGGYMRLFPLRFLQWGIRTINRDESQPAVIYFHPWEIDTGQPRLNGSRLSSFRHHINIHKTLPKLESLLKAFRFAPIKEVFSDRLNTSVNRVDG